MDLYINIFEVVLIKFFWVRKDLGMSECKGLSVGEGKVKEWDFIILFKCIIL